MEVVVFEETGEKRKVVGGCLRCGVTPADIEAVSVVVSPTGKAHYGGHYGITTCGIDATGDGWWWPL